MLVYGFLISDMRNWNHFVGRQWLHSAAKAVKIEHLVLLGIAYWQYGDGL